jgi:hypothetical protein
MPTVLNSNFIANLLIMLIYFRQLSRKFSRLKLRSTVLGIFGIYLILLIINFFLFSTIDLPQIEVESKELFVDYSIITLLRGPTEALLKSNPDTYHFEINSLQSYLRLLPPNKIYALIDDASQCPEILKNVGDIRCLEIPCRFKRT